MAQDWYLVKGEVKKSEGALDIFPSYYERMGNVEIRWLLDGVDMLSKALGCRDELEEAPGGLRLECRVPAERWPMLKDTLRVLSKMKYLPHPESRLKVARVKNIHVSLGRDIIVSIELDEEDWKYIQ